MEQHKIHMDTIETSLSCFRMTFPARIKAMERSLSLSGQLNPVIVRRHEEKYQLLDGFKRFHAAQSLKWEELMCRPVEADNILALVMILLYNNHRGGLEDYEQAKIVHSLKREHLLSGEEIAKLTGKSISWVSRRLSFIERLDESACTSLRLGQITSTHARELSRLPRGNQDEFVRLIIDENLTSRETGFLVKKYLSAKTGQEAKYLMSHPREVLDRALVEEEDTTDCRLSEWGNRILKTSRILMKQQHIFIGQSSDPPLEDLDCIEFTVLLPFFRSIAINTKKIQSLLKPHV